MANSPRPRTYEATTSLTASKDGVTNVAQHEDDGDYEEEDCDETLDKFKNEIDDEDYDGGLQTTPISTKVEYKGKFGGSAKGRECHRWTPAQEAAAVEHMLNIRAEGKIIGEKAFQELHNRLLATFGVEWNHTVSGIHNAWFRRDLGKRVKRQEARKKAQKEIQEQLEDTALGLSEKSKRERKRKSSIKSGAGIKRVRSTNHTDDEMDGKPAEKKADDVTRALGVDLSLLNITTPNNILQDGSFASTLLPIATTPASSLPLFEARDYPTVTIAFKHFSNNTHRRKPFTACRDVRQLFTQAVTGQVFKDVTTQYMVLAAKIGSSKKYIWMAQNDEDDYEKLV